MSKEELKANIIEVRQSDSDEGPMMCPYRTDSVKFTQPGASGKPTEDHQRADFTPCYKERCWFYKNHTCRKVEKDVGGYNYKR